MSSFSRRRTQDEETLFENLSRLVDTTPEKRFLLPGEFAISDRPAEWSTLLGSCVSVCIRHRDRPIAAMNHFLLDRAQGRPEVGRYGDSSCKTIIRGVLRHDRDALRYHVSILGGAAVLDEAFSAKMAIGERNIAVAKETLTAHGFRIGALEVGGTTGRRLAFDTATGKITVAGLGAERQERRMGAAVVVDQSPRIRRRIRAALEPSFREVFEASSPFVARNKIVETNADLITLDAELPTISGLKFLERIHQFMPRPVIMIAECAAPGSALAAEAAYYGAVASLDKTDWAKIPDDELRRAIESTLPRVRAWLSLNGSPRS